MATSEGDLAIGRVRMPGPATLYEGAVVETGKSPAQLQFRNGATVRLGSDAKATVYAKSISLERGVGQVDMSGEYVIRAQSLTVVPTSTPARARLQVTPDGALQVAALSGSFEVLRGGVLPVSKMSAGGALSFAPETAEAAKALSSTQFKGCLAKSENRLFLHQDNSKSVVALEGSVKAQPGDRVTVVGKIDQNAAPVAGATAIVKVAKLTVDGHGCSAKPAVAGAAAGTAAGAAAGSTAAAGAAGTAAAGAGAAGAGAAGAATAGTAAAAAGIGATTVAVGAAVAGAAIIPTVALTNDSSPSTSTGMSPSSR